MNWQTAARKLWGDDWQTPLANVTGLSRRTVSYWAAGTREPPDDLAAALVSIAEAISPDQARAYGAVWLAWLAGNDTLRSVLDYARYTEAMARKFSQDRRNGKLADVWRQEQEQQV